jgi:hypothetical protein
MPNKISNDAISLIFEGKKFLQKKKILLIFNKISSKKKKIKKKIRAT